jgi:hypothetical protein
VHAFLWWLAYTVAAVWIQRALPGLDAFGPAVVILLQERRLRQLLWLLPCWILLQEGMGSAPFGTMILWYAGLVVFFVLGRWLFESRNVLFVFFIGVFMGGWHFLLLSGMAVLQGLALDPQRLAWDSVQQAVAFPLGWAALYTLYVRQVRNVVAV